MMKELDQLLIQQTMAQHGLNEAEARRRVEAEVNKRVADAMRQIGIKNGKPNIPLMA